jgi:hypothetical protein
METGDIYIYNQHDVGYLATGNHSYLMGLFNGIIMEIWEIWDILIAPQS